ncbi:MAG: MerR family transcriptional regulator [Bacillota bacterium]
MDQNTKDRYYLISEASKITKLPKKTIRYYENIGLIPPLKRNQGKYRIFSKEDVRRLVLIKKAKYLGISLREIKELVDLAFDSNCKIFETKFLQLLADKITEVDETINDLHEFRKELVSIKDYMHNNHEQFSEDCRLEECEQCAFIDD